MSDYVTIPVDTARRIASDLRTAKSGLRHVNGSAERIQGWVDLLDPKPMTLRQKVLNTFQAWTDDGGGYSLVDSILDTIANDLAGDLDQRIDHGPTVVGMLARLREK